MRMSFAAAGAVVALVSLGQAAPVSAQKAPKRAVVFDGNVELTSGVVEDLATVTLRRFKKKHILRIEASLELVGAFPGQTALLNDVTLNGHVLPFDSESCVTTSCYVEGSTFADLDVLAASFPDDFKGKPLVVVVRGRAEVDVSPALIRRLRVLVHLLPK